MRWRGAAAALAVLAAGRADAVSRGSKGRATEAPATKSAGTGAERPDLPDRDAAIAPSHGLLGAPGAAPDANGPTRLGTAVRETPGTYGQGVRSESSTWQSGDRVRSRSSGDVRQARQQQAPDLEFVGGAGAKDKVQGPSRDEKGQP